jgi:hypothetical protein
MKSFLFAGVLITLLQASPNAPARADTAKPSPTTRPTSAPASRPASPDAPLTLERRKAYNLALKDARQQKNSKIEEARRQFHAEMEQKTKKTEGTAPAQARESQQTAAAERKPDLSRRARRRALTQQKNAQKAEPVAQPKPEKPDVVQERYAAGLVALSKLEGVSQACREYAVDKEYEQWSRTAAAKHRAETDLAKVDTKLLPSEVKSTVQAIETSIREEVLKL